MEIAVLDTELNLIDFVDYRESYIWTERYGEAGDFELYFTASSKLLSIFQNGYYLYNAESNYMMIVETIKCTYDDDGSHVAISGRSLESLLDRRIVWGQFSYFGQIQSLVKKLITENIIAPTEEKRKIPNFIFRDNTKLNRMFETVDIQYNGENLYDAIVSICATYNLGFRVYVENMHDFVFELYSGEDRSYDQITNPYVVFSPDFDNISEINYITSIKESKNVCMIAGEGEGSNQKTAIYGDAEGLNRKEVFLDCSKLSTTTKSGSKISDATYKEQLIQSGREEIDQYKNDASVEGKITNDKAFVYGTDYNLGDIVVIDTGFGITRRGRITEYIRSIDSSGSESYPTYEIINENVSTYDILLPEGYTRVQYVENVDARVYIPTDYILRAHDTVETMVNVAQSAPTNWSALFGARKDSYSYQAYYFFTRTNGSWAGALVRTGKEAAGPAFTYGKRVKLVTKDNIATWQSMDDTTAEATQIVTGATIEDSYCQCIFFDLNKYSGEDREHGITIDQSPSYAKMYYFKVFDESGKLIRYFTPALDSNGVPCMYEAITKTTKYGVGTGALKYLTY